MMTETRILAKNVRTGGTWQTNKSILIQDGIITAIDNSGPGDDYDYEYVSAGLIDNHLHGGFGFSVTSATEQTMAEWLRKLVKHGICGVSCCTYGNYDTVRNALAAAKTIMQKQKEGIFGGAEMLGVHLEGPFINPQKCGSMAVETLLPPNIQDFCRYIRGYEDIISEVTLAPEFDLDFALIRYLKSKHIRILAGHTACDYETARHAFQAGVGASCHTFNAMSPLQHRSPGLVSAALTDPAIYCEMIGDLIHLHPGTVHLIHTCKGALRTMIISDAVETTGQKDGVYWIDGMEVHVKNGESRLPDGTLYGGGCLISETVHRLYRIGLPATDILLMASETPAQWLGLTDWSVQVGNPARITCWNKELQPMATYFKNDIFLAEP